MQRVCLAPSLNRNTEGMGELGTPPLGWRWFGAPPARLWLWWPQERKLASKKSMEEAIWLVTPSAQPWLTPSLRQ